MFRPVLPVFEVLSLLQQTPPRIAEITGRLTHDQLHSSPGPGEWSANNVLAHLRACADVWGDNISKILRQDTPTIRAVNPRTYIKSTDYLDREFVFSLRTFTKQRADLLAVLEELESKSWSRKANRGGKLAQTHRADFRHPLCRERTQPPETIQADRKRHANKRIMGTPGPALNSLSS